MPTYKIEGNALQPVAPATFGAAHGEDRLETILQASGDELGVCFIARQPHTDHGKRPDLVGISADGEMRLTLGTPRGPDVFWCGRQWNHRRTDPRAEVLMSYSKELVTALQAGFGTVECDPTGHGGYPKWIVRGHVGDAAHAYEPAWIVANVEAALRCRSPRT